MKKIKIITSIFVLLLSMAFLVGCAKKVKLTYEDGTVFEEIEFEKGQVLDIEDPVKEGHTFIGWYLDGEEITFPHIFNKSSKVVAKFKINVYKYEFKVGNKVVKKGEAEYGSTIEYPENPTKPDSKSETYTFAGWDNDAKTLLKDEVFNAEFTSEIREFTYTFENTNGEIIKSVTAKFGTVIEYPDVIPVKESNEEYDYVFAGWDQADKTVYEDIVFRPIFNGTKKQFTYKFYNYNGELLKEAQGFYGALPEAPYNPRRENDENTRYVFAGWDKELVPLKENAEYTAVYNEVANTLDGLKVSILGDSISTFYAEGSELNSYYTSDDLYYYPKYSPTIKTVDQTWWAQLLKNTNMTLGINNSWSGSCAFGSGDSAGQSDARLYTLDENGIPDILIVYLGTNDLVNGFSVNEYRTAMTQIMYVAKKIGISDVFFTTLGYSAYRDGSYSEEARLAYNEEIRKMVEEFNCGLIPLDEYIVDDNYMIYLGDRLHYNAKGATLLSKVFEKAIKEYYGIKFDEEIVVEHNEKLPEDILGKITADADGANYWKTDGTGYADKVFFGSPNVFSSSPLFSLRMEIKKNEDNGKYYVIAIHQSGESTVYGCDYVLTISDQYKELNTALYFLERVVVGSIVEFDASVSYPVDITFKEGDGNAPEKENADITEVNPPVEGQLHVGAYNQGVWSVYDRYAILYDYSQLNQDSTYINFALIKLVKDGDNYKITGLKNVDVVEDFAECELYVMIYRDLASDLEAYYHKAEIGQTVVIHGDPTTGSCNIEFK